MQQIFRNFCHGRPLNAPRNGGCQVKLRLKFPVTETHWNVTWCGRLHSLMWSSEYCLWDQVESDQKAKGGGHNTRQCSLNLGQTLPSTVKRHHDEVPERKPKRSSPYRVSGADCRNSVRFSWTSGRVDWPHHLIPSDGALNRGVGQLLPTIMGKWRCPTILQYVGEDSGFRIQEPAGPRVRELHTDPSSVVGARWCKVMQPGAKVGVEENFTVGDGQPWQRLGHP